MRWRGIGGAVGVVWLVACGGASEGGDATGANGAGAESAAGGAGDPGPGGAGAGATGAGNASAGGAGGGAGEGGSGDPPPGRILFQMDYPESAWPLAGWPWAVDEAFGVRWTRELLPGAGPNGQNVAQLTELPGTGQHGWGWHGHVVPQMEQGEGRFVRWRHRVTEESNCAVTTSNKLLVVAQGCEGGLCRVIVQPKCNPEGLIQYNFQVDGGVYQVETGYVYPKGQWLNVQLEIQTSSAAGRADGALREWIDSDDYDAPTIANTDIELIAGGESSAYVIVGGYNNTEEVPAVATNVQQYTDFEIPAQARPNAMHRCAHRCKTVHPSPTPNAPHPPPIAPRFRAAKLRPPRTFPVRPTESFGAMLPP